jgi:hypothetical protein
VNSPFLAPDQRWTPGVVWGGRQLLLEVAGTVLAITGLDGPQQACLLAAMGAYQADPGARVDARLEVRRAAREAFAWPAMREYQLHLGHGEPLPVSGYGFLALLPEDPANPAQLFTCEHAGESFLGAFENTLRVHAALRLRARGGLLLHSVALVVDGAARVFFGHSGDGKSTLARRALEAGTQVLSDDLNALEIEDGRWRVRKLPFAGELGRQPGPGQAVPLASLSRLQRGTGFHRRRLGSASAIASLLACAPFANRDAGEAGLISIATALCENGPVHEIQCTLDTPLDDILQP